MHLSVQQLHAEHVEALALAVLGAHVNLSLQPQRCTRYRGCYSVLPRSGFGDNAGFAHPLRQQRLPQRVVDFVCSAVGEVFAFEVDFGAAEPAGEVFGEVKRGWPAHEFGEVIVELLLEAGVFARLLISLFQLLDRGHEHFGHESVRRTCRICRQRGSCLTSFCSHQLPDFFFDVVRPP